MWAPDWEKRTTGKSAGQWRRGPIDTWSYASERYRSLIYVCPDCNCRLFPLKKGYRYGCAGCGLIFGYGFRDLYGFGAGHERAEYMTYDGELQFRAPPDESVPP